MNNSTNVYSVSADNYQKEIIGPPQKPFDFIKCLTVNKTALTEKQAEEWLKKYEPFMINRIISMLEQFLPLANLLNRRNTLSKYLHYKILYSALPKRNYYFDYIKKPKEINKDKEKLVSKYFGCGSRDLDEILKMLNEDQIEEIVNKYSGGVDK